MRSIRIVAQLLERWLMAGDFEQDVGGLGLGLLQGVERWLMAGDFRVQGVERWLMAGDFRVQAAGLQRSLFLRFHCLQI